MPGARDYYYQVTSPDEFGLSYQRVHQAPQFLKVNDPRVLTLLNHKPRRSNDPLIDAYLDELDSTVDPRLRARLDQVFVAKKRDFVANARALRPEQYEGDLVFFNVGLSDACFQFSTLFAELVQLVGLDLPEVEYKRQQQRLIEDAAKLRYAQEMWAESSQGVRLHPETVLEADADVVDLAVHVATLMDKSILCHELAHHFLGHTGQTDDSTELLLEQSGPYLHADLTDSHRREHQADVAGILMPLAGVPESRRERAAADIALGNLLALTVLAQLDDHPYESSDSHPSPADRFETGLRTLRSAANGSIAESVVDDVIIFQRLLFGTQRRGLNPDRSLDSPAASEA